MVFSSKDSIRNLFQIKLPSESFLFPGNAHPVDGIFKRRVAEPGFDMNFVAGFISAAIEEYPDKQKLRFHCHGSFYWLHRGMQAPLHQSHRWLYQAAKCRFQIFYARKPHPDAKTMNSRRGQIANAENRLSAV